MKTIIITILAAASLFAARPKPVFEPVSITYHGCTATQDPSIRYGKLAGWRIEGVCSREEISMLLALIRVVGL